MNPTNSPSQSAEVHKGLEGVVAGDTSISEVDGTRCQLIYRGYNIDELVGSATYEEVSYLLLHDRLPTVARLGEWTKALEANRPVPPELLSVIQHAPAQAAPMAILRTAISTLGLLDPEADDDAPEAIRQKAVRAIARTPSIVATLGRVRAGHRPVVPKPGLSHAASFLYMLHGTEPNEAQTLALDSYFILLADHGFNASTFTARTVTGTRSDYYSALTAAIGSLKGPLHGAANRRAMEMLLEIGAPEHVDPYVKQTLTDHKRFMGFGHRVYKGEDPRAKHLKTMAKRLGDNQNEMKWFTISERLREAVWKAKGLYVNVDFYSASLLHLLGISTELFTTMFACARVAGWSSHIIEQASDNRLIRPLAHYIGPRDLRFTPIDSRSESSPPRV